MPSAKESLVIAVGPYECSITGNKELISLIPDHWQKYQKENETAIRTVNLHLEKGGIDLTHESDSDGWALREAADYHQAVNFHHGKPIFAIEYCDNQDVVVRVAKALDSYVRVGIHYGLMTALHQECIGLHGVTLQCGNEIIILSAPSGTGKTTLAKLLEQYCDAIAINGDFALLHPTEEGVIFEPTLFCGTSRRCLNFRLRVNRIVFLSQAKENIWHELSGREAVWNMLNNAFVPTWDRGIQQAVQENIMKCLSAIKVNAYAFAPTQEAAETFFRELNS